MPFNQFRPLLRVACACRNINTPHMGAIYKRDTWKSNLKITKRIWYTIIVQFRVALQGLPLGISATLPPSKGDKKTGNGNSTMGQIGTVTFTGASGKTYTFTAYTLDTTFNEVGAVYIFTKQENRAYTPLYIGRTNNLKQRISNHEKWPCVRRYGVNSICVLVESSALSRLQIESDLLDMGNPPCNDQ